MRAALLTSSLSHTSRIVTPRRHLVRRPAALRLPVRSLFGFFGSKEQEASMGSSASKGSAGWQPSADAAGTDRRVSKAGYDVTPLTAEERQRKAAELTDFQRYVTLQAGTERAFTGKTVDGTPHDNKRKGVYVSAIGDLPLFTSDTKFDSGTGWPSFYAPVDPAHIVEIQDNSIPFMPRTEVVCARGGAHLGHVFNDGPRPTGKRYCINAAALKFIPEGEQLPEGAKKLGQ